jgi:hypothetical protein
MMLKKTVSVIVLLVFLFTTVGYSVTNHYCLGKIHKQKISFLDNSLTCGMEVDAALEKPFQTKVKTNCCKNVVEKVKINDQFDSFNLDLNIWNVNPSMILPELKISLTTNIRSQYYFGLSPPPLITASLNILFATFLI